MAGRPLRRARLDAVRAAAADPPGGSAPQPSKPLAEMTPDEKRQYLGQLRKEIRALGQPGRDRLLRRGRAKPRNNREWAIFAKDLTGQSDPGTRPDPSRPGL